MSDIFYLSLKQQEETNYKCQIFFLLHTKLKGGFSMEMFFLSCVNETMHLLWNLPFFKMVPPKANFFLFSNFGLIIAQQTSIHINCFMAGRWQTSCHPTAKMHIVGEGPGETPSALRWLSYLINSFLTDIKQLAKTSRGGALSAPLLMSMSDAFSAPFYNLIKLCYTKVLE